MELISDQIFWEVHIKGLSLGLSDEKLIASVVEVKLVGKVGREKIGHGGAAC